MIKRTTLRSTDSDNTTVISIYYSDEDFERLPWLPNFLEVLDREWERLIDHRPTEPPFPGVICAQDGCAEVLTSGDIALEETHCESHQVDAWGVTEAECYCYQSAADNADIDICGPHQRAFDARGEGPFPSSFRTS